jgi:hypothetical protein
MFSGELLSFQCSFIPGCVAGGRLSCAFVSHIVHAFPLIGEHAAITSTLTAMCAQLNIVSQAPQNDVPVHPKTCRPSGRVVSRVAVQVVRTKHLCDVESCVTLAHDLTHPFVYVKEYSFKRRLSSKCTLRRLFCERSCARLKREQTAARTSFVARL